MKTIIQRVRQASVHILDEVVVKRSIGKGLMILVGFCNADGDKDVDWMIRKISGMRIFSDENGKMNKCITDADIDGQVLVVSQFTLYADVRKGNRPSFNMAAQPDNAVGLYKTFVSRLSEQLGKPIQTGRFGARMEVHIVNDGPVTIIADSAVS